MFAVLIALSTAVLGTLVWDLFDDDDDSSNDSAAPEQELTTVQGTVGDDEFPALPYGTSADEGFYLLDGDDTAFGNGGDDVMLLGTGDDFANGGLGDDLIRASAGNDTLYGSAGDDVLRGGGGADFLDGESDDDMLFGNLGSDELFGGAGDDELFGGAQDDTLSGGAGMDLLEGEDGDDSLDGAFDITGRTAQPIDTNTVAIDQGADILRGGPGEDLMIFGPGDTVSGGLDEDLYVGYVTTPWAGAAEITDMESGAELALELTRVTATPDATLLTQTAQGADTMVSYDGTDIVLLRNIAEGQFSITLVSNGVGITV